MKATINGELRELPEEMTVENLLTYIEAPERGIAVAKNDRVVRRASFPRELVREGDRIEIIRAVAGG